MDFTFDPAKDALNRERHEGLSLQAFEHMYHDAVIAVESPRGAEMRHKLLGPIAGRLHVAIITMRGVTPHVISLRKANTREQRFYAQTRRDRS